MMSMRRPALVLLALVMVATPALLADAPAQSLKGGLTTAPPSGGGGGRGGVDRQYIPRAPSHVPETRKAPRPRLRNLDVVVPGILLTLPHAVPSGPPSGGRFIDDGSVNEDVDRRRRPTRRANRRNQSGVPPAGEQRLVPDEVVIELPANVSPQAVTALEQRHQLARIASTSSQLTGTTVFHWRIPDQRSVPEVIRALEADAAVSYAQPNYVYALPQHGAAKSGNGDPAQYALAKMRLSQAHSVTRGEDVRVAVIDSGVDATHPDLNGAVVESFNALSSPDEPHEHGTAIAGLIAANGRLLGVAPGAKILAARAFNPAGDSTEGTTFDILKAFDWAATNGAQIINMSFAGPSDPVISRILDAAHKRNIVLIAAAGNDGPKSAPLYPAAHPHVIAVSATDADDKLFQASNRGRHISVAAPGVDILVPVPGEGYKLLSGTSFSCAEISGVAALLLAGKPGLRPAAVRDILLATAKDLGPKGRDTMFGAGLADAYRAIGGTRPLPVASDVRLPPPRLTSGER